MSSLGFGIERIGLIPVRYPKIILVVILCFSAFCAAGLTKLKPYGALSELFRSDTPEFARYQELGKKFPTSEFDVFVIIEGQNLLQRDLLEEIRNFQLELQLIDIIHGVVSIFSVRGKPDENGYAAALFPAEIPEGEEFQKLTTRAMAHPLISGKLLSERDEQGQIMLMVLSLKPEIVHDQGLDQAMEDIDATARDILVPMGIRYSLAGAPVMEKEIRSAIRRDRLVYNISGFIIGFIICLAFFRRPSLVMIACLCPAFSVLWVLGILGLTEHKLTTLMNVIPPLIMVIAYTDAMHMIFSIRRQIRQGRTRQEAVCHAVRTVGPACVLTSLTTAIAMLSLIFADSALVKTFGYAAVLSTLLAFVSVILVVPLFTILMIRDEKKFALEEQTNNVMMAKISDLSAKLSNWIIPRYSGLAIFGAVLVVILTIAHLQLRPNYRLSDQVPDDHQSVSAMRNMETKLSGAFPIHIMIQWPESQNSGSPSVMDAITETHALLEKSAIVGNVWSLNTLRQWLKSSRGDETAKTLSDYVSKLPEHLQIRFLNDKENAALVTGRVPDLNSEKSVPVIEGIDLSLNVLRKKYPDFKFSVTGLAVVSALQSTSMIRQLGYGLMGAYIVVILLIGIAFRSPTASILSIIPNVFPIVAVGTFLYIGGGGLQYASVIALTVAFGIAVDDTIHFLNRFHLEQSRSETIEAAVRQTIVRIGPVLFLTTFVLVLGLAVTILSELPPLRLFGELFMTTLCAAFVADIIYLPASILFINRFGETKFFQSDERQKSTNTLAN